MIVKKSGGKIFGAELTAAERKALNMEIHRQLSEQTEQHLIEIDAVFLWFLAEEFGFGPKRLRRVYERFNPKIRDLCKRYEMYEDADKVYLCTAKLKERGIDLEKWSKEVGA